MATPLADLLNGLRNDTGMRADFELSPAEFLDAHGWGSLDATDLQEACYILADGAPPDDAARWLAGGEALGAGDGDGDAAGALVTALAAVAPATFDLDPADLDGLDELDADDADDGTDADAAGEAADADPGIDEHGTGTPVETGLARSVDPNDATIGDTGDAVDDASSPADGFDLGGEPEGLLDDHSLVFDPVVDAREAGDFGDDWDELI